MITPDIAILQPCSCFHINVLTFSFVSRFHSKLVIENEKRLSSAFYWKTLRTTQKVGKRVNSERIRLCRGGLTIRSVATVEITGISSINIEVNQHQNMLRMDIDSIRSDSYMCEPQSAGEDSTELDEREKLRRHKISQANKGNMPWNKGKKHSPETLQRIKERTRIAMQNPKVKMKLVNLGHAQSKETRMKIGAGVRLGWKRRREKLMLQETCYYEWQNLLAEASRKGLLGEEELQWDSYKLLNKQHEEEWLQSVEQRKKMLRPKGSKRAPKSAEQKRKIAASIAAKWANPEYRERVCSGLAKFHGIPEGAERRPKRKPSGDGQTRKRSPKEIDDADDVVKGDTRNQNQRIRLKKNCTPLYKDPLASSKLEMLINIRAQRVSAVNKRSVVISRAKLLISEAEKAASVLELTAKYSPLARASLLESRALISEAMQLINTVESDDPFLFDHSETTEPLCYDEEKSENLEFPDDDNLRKINGVLSISLSDIEADDVRSIAFSLPDMMNGSSSNTCHDGIHKILEKPHPNGFSSQDFIDSLDLTNTTKYPATLKPTPNGNVNNVQIPLLNGVEKKLQPVRPEAYEKKVKITKWVCGRLVEVEEDT